MTRGVVIGFGYLATIVMGLSLLAVAADPQRDPPQRPAYNTDIITLREYVDMRFAAQEKAVEAALAAVERSNLKSEGASDKRFDADSAEYMQAHKSMDKKLQELQSRVAAAENRSAGSSQTWSLLIGAVGIGSLIVAV